MLVSRQNHRLIFTGSLMLIAVSLPLSIFTTSMAQFILVGNWLAEGEFRKKWERLRSRPEYLIFIGLYFIHILGLLWTSDLSYGFKDLQIKLPLLLLPLVAGSSECLENKDLRRILFAFNLGVLVSTFASVLAMLGFVPVKNSDFRSYSLFISHIRFSLMIVLAWAVSVNYLFIREKPVRRSERIFYLVNLFWLPLFLVFLRSLSGIVIFFILVFFFSLIRILKMKEPVTRFMLFVFLLLIPLLSLAYIGNVVKNYYTEDLIDYTRLDSLTIEGNPYVNLVDNKEKENGHFVWLYVCFPELEREWAKVSSTDFNGKDQLGQRLKSTLVRYMSSKNLRKDAAGFRQLGPNDIAAIEKGMTNVIFLKKFSLYPRIYEVVWELDSYRINANPNSHSIIQRMYYLKAGWNIASRNLLFGVGTGDVPAAFKQFYIEANSPLLEKWRRRAHNQYLTFLLTFGIPGFILVMLSMIYPVIKTRQFRFFLPAVFLIIMALSMLNEDTLETSAGATPFALFYVLLILSGDRESKEIAVLD